MGLDEGQLCGVVPIPVCKACQQEFGAFGPEVHLASVGERVVGLHGLTTLSLLTAFMTTPRGSTGLEPRRVGIWVQVSRGESHTQDFRRIVSTCLCRYPRRSTFIAGGRSTIDECGSAGHSCKFQLTTSSTGES